jgi:uncharacterized membrane protein YphA (DoxX/SURF4 family)
MFSKLARFTDLGLLLLRLVVGLVFVTSGYVLVLMNASILFCQRRRVRAREIVQVLRSRTSGGQFHPGAC